MSTYQYEIEACVDCLAMLANGETGSGEAYDARHAADMDAQWPESDGWELVPDCPEECEGSFSWAPCDGCGSRLGGDRHPVAVFLRETV